MDRLSSCYFCGAALDASLDEYPVVPAALRPDAETRKTAVLCGTCRRKLDAVLESVADAVEGRDGDALETALGDAEGLRSVGAGEPTEESTDVESTGGASDAGSAVGSTDAEPTETEPNGSDADRGGEQPWISGEEIASDAGESPGADSDEQPAENAAESDGETDGTAESRPGRGGSGTGTDAETGSATGASDRSTGETSAADATEDSNAADGAAYEQAESDDPDGPAGTRDAGDRSREADASDGESDASGGSAELSDAKLTRLENTKVMRLLQNREFPVDKQEFVTVATSAYDVSGADCEKILELAIRHDLLDEENGQLLAGDR